MTALGWFRCPVCGRRDWIYTARHLASVQRIGHTDWRPPFPRCDGEYVAEDG